MQEHTSLVKLQAHCRVPLQGYATPNTTAASQPGTHEVTARPALRAAHVLDLLVCVRAERAWARRRQLLQQRE